jgi:hypothetical protein
MARPQPALCARRSRKLVGRGGCRAPRSHGSAAGSRRRTAALGPLRGATVRLPCKPLRSSHTEVARLLPPTGDGLSARKARNAGAPRVRRLLRDAPTSRGPARAHTGDARRDARARALRGSGSRARIPDTDRNRYRELPRRPGASARAREALALPVSAFVVGSFQKDASAGRGPRAEARQGPDVFVAVVERLRRRLRSSSCS